FIRNGGHHGLLIVPAEDGIRDATVTGVQTCALPILIGTTFALFMLVLPSLTLPASEGVQWDQNLVPEENVVLQKNIVYMHIPADNKLPFACVWGAVQNAAPGYPVIIQIYKDGKPVYFVQTDFKSDGYE